jgi:hypothetical protein
MEPKIDGLIREWKVAQERYIQAREIYRAAWARAYLATDAKTDTARKAAADVATSEARLARDMAETHAQAAWQLMLAERGRIESSSMPGKHFEDAA